MYRPDGKFVSCIILYVTGAKSIVDVCYVSIEKLNIIIWTIAAPWSVKDKPTIFSYVLIKTVAASGLFTAFLQGFLLLLMICHNF